MENGPYWEGANGNNPKMRKDDTGVRVKPAWSLPGHEATVEK